MNTAADTADAREEAKADWNTGRRARATGTSGQGPRVVTPRERPGSDPNRIWRGFGTALCWWANGFGDTEIADSLADIVFSLAENTPLKLLGNRKRTNTQTEGVKEERLPGLGLNVVRYNVGGSSDAPNRRGESMARGKGFGEKGVFNARVVEGFWVNAANGTANYDAATEDPTDAANWNWTADAAQVAMLKKARERGADTFELFSNSPMWWMLRNHNTAGGPCDEANPLSYLNQCVSTHDNLKPEMLRAQAHYLTEVWKHASRYWGITFSTIEPFNEPGSAFWHADNGQEGCHYTAQMQCEFVRELHEMMKRKGILTEAGIAVSDENSLAGDHPLATPLGVFTKAKHSWERMVEEGLAGLVKQVNVHAYSWIYYGLPLPPRGATDDGQRANYDSIFVRDEFRRLTSGRPRAMSEYSRGADSRIAHADDFQGLQLARVIILDIKWLQPSEWCIWQIVDPATSWGLIKGDPTARSIDGASGGFFVFAQFTRHIRPGMRILETNPYPSESRGNDVDPAEDDDMALVATSDDKVVVVVGPAWPQGHDGWDAGRGGAERHVEFDLAAFSPSGEAQVWCTYTGDIQVDRRGETPEASNFKLQGHQYDQWRKTKYERRSPVRLRGHALRVVLPRETVCTYEVPRLS